MEKQNLGSHDATVMDNDSFFALSAIDNPFKTPLTQSRVGSRAASIHSSAAVSYVSGTFSKYIPDRRTSSQNFEAPVRPPRQRKFKSARLMGTYDKPWTQNKDPRMVWDKVFFWGLALVGLGVGAYIIYTGWNSVENPSYCLMFEDDFSNGINDKDWNYEVELSGYGSGSFDWTTKDEKNAYADEKGLHIVPTVTTEATNINVTQTLNGYTLNLTAEGVCTSSDPLDCVRVSNSTTGSVINPVRSARLTTKGKHSITYGKVEVVAKLPKGSWLWPAIWMMPEDSVYGGWPASGEIDIMESKGNDGSSYRGGRNLVGGTLHWAPQAVLDAFYRTSGVRYLKRNDYSDSFHTYAVEWSENYIYTWVDSRIALDPWSVTGRYNTPFDEAFYLILNVAVGATNGYFTEGYRNKPWVDGSETAAKQFLESQPAWEPTWGEGDTRGMTVQSVKMFSRGVCGA
ncbi:Beta-1 [Hyphodiscus hymeniophilus]|uniref:Beta-1 n=1 Tax=Hyphodiscus hymeniophilus TaxID=353542 RepID=A0A9P6SN45_9HELO|nr:Beta-1 [Hyphodiscus hymeniophilus]